MDTAVSDVLDMLVEALAQRVAEKLGAGNAGAGKELYTVEELAARYGLSKSAVRQRVQAGEFGEVLHLGDRCYRVTAAGVEKYEREHTGLRSTERPAARPARRQAARARRDPGPI